MSQETKETQEMNQGQAVNVLIQAARIAQQKGAFTLEEPAALSFRLVSSFGVTNDSVTVKPTL